MNGIEIEIVDLRSIIPGALITLIISLFGFFGNSTIFIATIFSEKLNSKCNTLIAMLAVADFVTQLGHLPYVYFALTGTLVKPLDFCFYIMTPSLIAMNFGTALYWAIGLDRLLSIKYPARYLQWSKLSYITIMTSPGLLYCIVFIVLGWKAASDAPTMCFIPEAYGPLAKNAWVGSTVLFNASVVATYVHMLIVIRRIKANSTVVNHSSAHDVRNRRLLKSIVIIMLLEVFGWFMNMSFLGTAIAVGSSFETIFFIEVYAGAVLNISVACNFYVYYYNSTEYRAAFKNVLCFWRKSQVENSYSNNNNTLASLNRGLRILPSPAVAPWELTTVRLREQENARHK